MVVHRQVDFRQCIAQGHQACGQSSLCRHVLRSLLQARHSGVDLRNQLIQRTHALRVDRLTGGMQALEIALGRRGRIGDFRYFRHREGTIHGVHGTDQEIVRHLRRLLCTLQPQLDCGDVATDFGSQDFQQYRIDLHRHMSDGNGRCDVLFFCGNWRFHRRRFNQLCFNRLCHNLIGCDLFDFNLCNRCRRFRLGFDFDHGCGCGCFRHDRRGVHRLLARRNAVGDGGNSIEVKLGHRLLLQRGEQVRQVATGCLHETDDCRRCRARAIKHAVQHVLDLPAELAKASCAHQATTALEGMEDATDRTQALAIVRLFQPRRHELAEIGDLFLEFLDEDRTNFIVDFVLAVIEAECLAHGQRSTNDGHGDGDRHRDSRLGGFEDRRFIDGRSFFFRNEFVRVYTFDHRQRRRHVVGRGHRLAGDPRHQRLVGRLEFGIDRRCFVHVRSRRQRPVMQRLQALAGDGEDVIAIAALVAQGFEVVLGAGERIGQRVELLAARHALLADEFVLGVEANPLEVFGRLRQFQHTERTGDFIEQARDFRQLRMIPTGFDEGDEALSGIAEIGDRFADQDRHQLGGVGRAHRAAFRWRQCLILAKACDLVFQRGIDEQQGAGDIKQRLFARRVAAIDHARELVALAMHVFSRTAEAEHAQRVANATERLDLRRQFRHVAAAGTQVQVERILHAEHVFLQRRRHRIQQRAVDARDAAARVFEFTGGYTGIATDRERRTQAIKCRRCSLAVGHLLQQLPHRFIQGRCRARTQAISVQCLARFARDQVERILQ